MVAGRWLCGLSAVPIVLVIVMVVALAARSRPILETGSIWDILRGDVWQPFQRKFGFLPFIAGTLWVTALAMAIATPPSLLVAAYLSEYARPATRSIMKPLLDLLAGIPSVVYGVWGVIAIVPWVDKTLAPLLSRACPGVPLFARTNPTGYGIMAGSIVLAVMVTPIIIAVSYEVMAAVPMGLREAALAVGATRWQAVKHAVVREAFPGIAAAVMLGFSRAFGETMAVLMVVGNVARVPRSVFDPAYPLTALIANNYGEVLSIPLYDAALMGAALVLLMVVVAFNIASALALRSVSRRLAA